MTNDWCNYLNSNSQDLSDCQLVAAVNAYYHLTGKKIKQTSKRYDGYVDLCGCRYGSAMFIEKVYKRLGLECGKKFSRFDICKFKKWSLPLVASVWHKRYGFHSVFILDYDSKTDALRVANFKYETSINGWIFREDFEKFLVGMTENGSINRDAKMHYMHIRENK